MNIIVQSNPGKGKEAALRDAQDWAEKSIVKMNGKLTFSLEKEILCILDKITWENS